MIKGLLSLFSSGIIFQPMVLLGIVVGFYAMFGMKAEQIEELFVNYHLYLLVLFISAGYVFGFKRVYKDDGISPDYGVMIFSSVMGVVKFVFAAVMAMSFVSFFSF